MSIYLPIAGISVNAFLVIGIGGGVGFLSGLFGVGGGFLLTPLLMMIGIPPAVAVASSANQFVATAASGAAAHLRRGNVNFKMGLIISLGGISGSTLGVQAVKVLRELGNFDLLVHICYVLLLGTIGGFMLWESAGAIHRARRKGSPPARVGRLSPPRRPLLDRLPFQLDFPQLGVRTSVLFPFFMGVVVGIFTAIMGVGGGFIMVPVMIYIIGMPTMMTVGTGLVQILITTVSVTIQQAVTNHTVDAVLAALLFGGSVFGAQIGARFSHKLRGEQIRIYLALILLLVAVKMLFDLLATPTNVIALVSAG